MKRPVFTLVIFTACALHAGAAAAVTTSHGMVKGFDGGLYLPYKPAIVRQTQQALEHRGLYPGPVNGILDETTMRATADFQKKNRIHVSGVPTPATRRALEKS
jgi:peptidoglycan hydrolase-like protein with peptidoglycan-binding domain